MSVLGALFLDLMEKVFSNKTGNARAAYPALVAKAREKEMHVEVAERKAA
jgi:hypothetical protein